MLSMTRSAPLPLLSALALALTPLAPAAAQAPGFAPAARGPVDVTADQLQVEQHDCLAIWSGDAEALQDTSRLRADTLKIYEQMKGGSAGGCGGLDRMEADGSVYYVTPTQVVKSDHAVYTAADNTIVLTGADVVAAQGKNVIAGSKMVINTKTGEATMDTGVRGRGQKGRVRAVLYPQSNAAAGPTGPTAPVPPPPRRHSQS
jgi:lipopolysaccharide export system protein LptA